MRNAIFLLLLLPCALFSQNNSTTFSGDDIDTYSTNSQLAIAMIVNTAVTDMSVEKLNSFVLEKKDNPPYAELLNFCFDCGNIKWSTASETNCSHFLIMYSRDGKSWNILGQIYGAGNSSAMNNYKYPTDFHEVYFKIYQIDFNGNSREYGPIFGSCKKQKKP
jgi:hypothetical protein